jgi:hypothetical protein
MSAPTLKHLTGTLPQSVMTFKPPRQYNWHPQPDITVYELALCLPVFFSVGWGVGESIDRLPPEALRLFVEVK